MPFPGERLRSPGDRHASIHGPGRNRGRYSPPPPPRMRSTVNGRPFEGGGKFVTTNDTSRAPVPPSLPPPPCPSSVNPRGFGRWWHYITTSLGMIHHQAWSITGAWGIHQVKTLQPPPARDPSELPSAIGSEPWPGPRRPITESAPSSTPKSRNRPEPVAPVGAHAFHGGTIDDGRGGRGIRGLRQHSPCHEGFAWPNRHTAVPAAVRPTQALRQKRRTQQER